MMVVCCSRRRLELWPIVMALAYAASAVQTTTLAFVMPTGPFPVQQQRIRSTASTTITKTTTCHLSSLPGDKGQSSNEDDEISKLIGKRSQIKRKSKEEVSPLSAFEPPEPTVDLDLVNLPEFKTERPVRSAKTPDSQQTNDNDRSSKKSQKKKAGEKADAPIIDYQADYEDENDNLHIPNRIGVTTIAWGDPSRNFVPSGKLSKRMIKAGKFVPGDLQLAFLELLQGGITFIETAPTYGGTSRSSKLSAEDILGRCLAERPADLPECIITEGVGGNPWLETLTGKGSLSKAMVNGLESSLSRLGVNLIELYQAPAVGPFYPSSFLCRALAAVVESGQCNTVGVQGVTRASTLSKIKNKLDDMDVPLISNSFEFSLTNQKHLNMIDACKQLNVIPLIVNPLDGGLASGVYTATNPSGGQQAAGSKLPFSFAQLEKLQPLHSVLETVAERIRTRVIRGMRDTQERFKSRYGPPPTINTDITTTQVALNYVIAKGGVPLPEVNSPAQAKEVLGCLGWSLTDDDVDMLEAAAALCKL